MKSICFILFN